jgi:thymidylate kinase
MKVVILGPDGAGKSSVIQGLMITMNRLGQVAIVRHLKPFLFARRHTEVIINIAPHSKQPRSTFTSLVKIFVWLIEEWYAYLLRDKQNELLICDRYYHDILIDTKRYRYGGPIWAAKLVGALIPHPALWVLLDATTEILQKRKQEVSPEETARQRQAYLDFIRSQVNHVIIDASQPLDMVIADVEHAVSRTVYENKCNRG